jgi:FAD/FMN-containing dehydrogenase
VLRLVPLPAERELAFASVASPEQALALLELFQDRMGDAISACELMSGPTMDIVLGHLGGRAPLAGAGWLVLIEVADSAGRLRERLEGALADAAEAGIVLDAALPDTAEQTRRFWTLRESVGEAERRGEKSVKHDVAVRVSDVPAFIRDAEGALARLSPALRTIVFGHLGDGNLHFNVVVPRRADGVSDGDVTRAVHDVVARFGGSITAEHGIGQYRTGELLRLKPPAELALMRRLKRALDPEGLLNPGKVVSGEPPSGWSPPL